MAKKLTLLAMSVVATAALFVPSTAAAEDFELLPVGTTIKVVSGTGKFPTNSLRVETALGLLTCTAMELTGELKKNGGTLLVEELKGSATGCTLGGKAITMTELKIKSTAEVEGKKTAEFRLSGTIPGGVTCHWTDEGEPGSFTYTKLTDETTFLESELFSAACGESAIAGKVTDEYFNKTTSTWEPAIWL